MKFLLRPLAAIAMTSVSLGGTSLASDAASAAAEESKPEGEKSGTYGDQIRSLLPVAWWSFDSDKPDLGESEGPIEFGKAGPTSEEFSTFSDDNRAAAFGPGKDGKVGWIRLEDVGPGSQFDFDNGDPITIEAWVNPSAKVPGNGNMYILGKGRTGNPGVAAHNQNYGFRLFRSGGTLNLSFLFRSRSGEGEESDWHRWDSLAGIAPGSGWHHVAVTYVFGEPESIRGYIDGERVEGVWSKSYAGATKRPPVVDDDEIWVGTSGGRSAGVSFHGLLDEVALYRRVLTEEQLVERYPLAPYVPDFTGVDLEDGKVHVEIVENLGKAGTWPKRFPDPTLSYPEEAFGFFRKPEKYVASGVRGDWSNPFLLRAAARIVLPEGEHELLLRTRGKGRLWLDGEVIAETEFGNFGGGAHNSVVEKSTIEGKDLRYLGPGDRETSVAVKGDGKPRVLVLEMIAGNGRVRATLGETSVSLRQKDGSFALLSPGDRFVPLTDAGWKEYRRERNAHLQELNQANRLVLRENEADYWQHRHEVAREFVQTLPPPAHGSVDAFLEASWAASNEASEKARGGIDFATRIKPILAENCYRCHDEKAKGGLRLSSREAAMEGGDSELPAIVPGKSDESLLVELIHPDADIDIMPPKGDPLPETDRELLSQWIQEGASYAMTGRRIEPSEPISDLEFLRRVTLDTVGVVPTAREIAVFFDDGPEMRRANAIDRLLEDPRWADHWTSYWQDVLAENPNILKPSLNNTGPFRFWIHEALHDNLPMDRFVTELVMMDGSVYHGGPAGFGMAAQNDVPMAAKAHILGTAFLGVEMKCARCHDSPYHETKQQDLFEMAAMLKRDSIKLPESSSVPMTTFEGRKPLIDITLKPGTVVEAVWPTLFAEEFGGEFDDSLLREKDDSRERLAALLTSPRNSRFARVVVNRLWKQFMGAGFVDLPDDWEASKPSHPELLDWLGRELVSNDYDLKHVARLILNSEAYQRKPRAVEPGVTPDFSAPLPRRMTAEQVVDSLFTSAGKHLESEELTMDNDGTQVAKNMISLGFPRRAWEFTSLSNERDRPSLAIPRSQIIIDVLENFGWRPSRQEPKSERETDPNVRQPAILANGALGRWVTTLSEDSDLTDLSTRADLTIDELVEEVFLRILTRLPTEPERALYGELLSEGFGSRVVPPGQRPPATRVPPLQHVSWSNHLSPEANTIKIEMEKRAREGDPPSVALRPEWRERMEDMVWALMNSPEFVFVP